MSGELVARLKASRDYYTAVGNGITDDPVVEAAARIEALEAEVDGLHAIVYDVMKERDAERALADHLANALSHSSPYVDDPSRGFYARAEGRDEVLRVYRAARAEKP